MKSNHLLSEEEVATVPLNKAMIAKDLQQTFQGKLSDEAITAMKNSVMKTFTNKYKAQGTVISALFYFRITVDLADPKAPSKQFRGNAGGIGSPGGGGAWGDIYTDDINRLVNDTTRFQFNSAAVYFNVNFFDKHSNLLGTFQSGSVSTVAATGGGKGKWY